MSKKLTTEEFIKKAKEVHGNKYDYSKVEYKDTMSKVCIICPIHGEFWQTPNQHVSNKHNCPKCSHQSYKYTTDEIIKKAKEVHGDKYDYSKVEYINSKTKVCIICPTHGEFWQTTSKHINEKQGCPKCNSSHHLTKEEFIEKANKKHNDKYSYNKITYRNDSTKITITCPIHGDFQQTPHNHLNGCGCPMCRQETNVSETKVFDFLNKHLKNNIYREIKLDFLKNKSLDIYIPDLKIAIEYQGRQHFEPIDFFGGIKAFNDTIKRDKEKYNLCKENGIKLFYISFEKHIPQQYFDVIFTDKNDLLTEIQNYGTNSRYKETI